MTGRLFTDGGSRGNPGPAACGCILFDDKNTVLDIDGKYLNILTNNQAEYHALILGLKSAVKKQIDSLQIYLDSELVIKQLQGLYKVKDNKMIKLKIEADKLLHNFKKTEYIHIDRSKNFIADKIVNLILDCKA